MKKNCDLFIKNKLILFIELHYPCVEVALDQTAGNGSFKLVSDVFLNWRFSKGFFLKISVGLNDFPYLFDLQKMSVASLIPVLFYWIDSFQQLVIDIWLVFEIQEKKPLGKWEWPVNPLMPSGAFNICSLSDSKWKTGNYSCQPALMG